MLNDTIAPEKREWVQRVLRASRNVLPESKEQFTDSPREAKPDEYGQGFASLNLKVPESLSKPLDDWQKEFSAYVNTVTQRSKLPPFHRPGSEPTAPKVKMISKSDWDQAATPMSIERKNFLLKNSEEIRARLNDMVKAGREFDYWNQVGIRLRDAAADEGKNKKAEVCDLTGIKPPDWLKLPDPAFNSVNAIPADKVEELKNLATDAHKEATNARDKALSVIGECQDFLDDPANNPERQTISKLLGELEIIDKEIPSDAGLTKELASKKLGKLHEIEGALFAWIDRRAQQGLPAAAESIALGDLIQKLHKQIIAEVVENDLPLTVADSGNLSKKENEEVQRLWESIKKGEKFKLPNPPSAAIGNEHQHKQQLEAKECRVEILANFARLLGSEAGRHLVGRLDAQETVITFAVGDSPTCRGEDSTESKPADLGSYDKVRQTHGKGSGATVTMPALFKDSDKTMATHGGNALFSPSFIIMGHELVHALHDAQGKSVAAMAPPLEEDAKWNNLEEYRTIIGGNISEQALRHQYGLSAERFGHYGTQPAQPIAEAIQTELDVAKRLDELKDKEPSVDTVLIQRGFEPTALTDKLKLDLYSKESIRGPLPEGWDPLQLDIRQIEAIAQKPGDFKYARFSSLGWKPFGLPATGTEGTDNLKDIIATQRHHPRSPLGRRFRKLGGEPALGALKSFQETSKLELATWAANDWPTLPQALEKADIWVTEQARDLVHGTSKLAEKLKAITMAWQSRTIQGEGSAKKSPVTALQEFLQKVPAGLPKKLDELSETLVSFSYKGDPELEEQIKFLELTRQKLSQRDSELKEIGRDPSSLSLLQKQQFLVMIDDLKAVPTADAMAGLLKGRCRNLMPETAKTLSNLYDTYKERSEKLEGVAKSHDLVNLSKEIKGHPDNLREIYTAIDKIAGPRELKSAMMALLHEPFADKLDSVMNYLVLSEDLLKASNARDMTGLLQQGKYKDILPTAPLIVNACLEREKAQKDAEIASTKVSFEQLKNALDDHAECLKRIKNLTDSIKGPETLKQHMLQLLYTPFIHNVNKTYLERLKELKHEKVVAEGIDKIRQFAGEAKILAEKLKSMSSSTSGLRDVAKKLVELGKNSEKWVPQPNQRWDKKGLSETLILIRKIIDLCTKYIPTRREHEKLTEDQTDDRIDAANQLIVQLNEIKGYLEQNL